MIIFLPSTGVSAWSIVWRMGVCGLGYGLCQTPNNIVMVSAAPMSRTGGAGGMQSTARLVGQTLGATAVTIVFAAIQADTCTLVHVCLWLSSAFAVIAGIFSVTRNTTTRPK